MRLATRILLFSLALGLFSAAASASNVPVGFVGYNDVGGGLFEFDAVSQTGPNSSGDPTWPVTNTISFTNLSLTVFFVGGGSFTYGPGYWSTDPGGLSYTGPDLPAGQLLSSAQLTGTFSPTLFDLYDGSHFNANPNFTATITDPSGVLQNGDFAIIYATPATGSTPEPGTLVLVGSGALGLLGVRRRKLHLNVRSWFSNRTAIAFFLVCLLLLPAATQAFASSTVKLNLWTSPTKGYNDPGYGGKVSLAGSGFPSGTFPPGDFTIHVWPTTCMSGTSTNTPGLLYNHLLGSGGKIQFLIPTSLAAGTYPVSFTDSTDGINSSNCSMMQVLQHTPVASCVPGASMGVLIQQTPPVVTAYVPNGAWCCGTTGVQVAQIEPSGGSFSSIPTPSIPNSCSSNSKTGETICTANTTDIYRITGTSLNTVVTSLANNTLTYSGGSCMTCGVAIDQKNNLAYMQIGISGSPSGGGIETFDLVAGTQSAFPTFVQPSEDIQVDPGRNYILSPFESNVYDLINTSTSPYTEFENFVSSGLSGDFDSAGEDCTTGIALSAEESFSTPYVGALYITDLTQAVFVPGSPGTWSAPQTSTVFPEFANMTFGTEGLAVAPGSHLAFTAGEFGAGQPPEVGVVTLPSTSGSGTPAFGDYVAAYLPNTPDGFPFQVGDDPHTLTAYASPSGGYKGLVADWFLGFPSYVAVVDMPGLLSAPRCNPAPGHQCLLGPHEVDPAINLLTYPSPSNPLVRYVQVH